MKIETKIIRQCDIGREVHIITGVNFWTSALVRNLNKLISRINTIALERPVPLGKIVKFYLRYKIAGILK